LHKRYEKSFSDFQWILDNCGDFTIQNVLYKQQGIIRARQKYFDEAEKYLEKASSFKKSETDYELFMWRGYICLVKKSYSEALEYFQQAKRHGQKGINKWIVEKEYIQTNIKELEKMLSRISV